MILENEVVVTENTGAAAVEDTAGNQKPESAHDGQNGAPEKKYTDEDVDKIVARKLAAERKKAAKARETDLSEREQNIIAREKDLASRELKATAICELAGVGLPATAADLLNYDSEDSYKESLAKLQSVIEDQRATWELERAKGRTPKAYRTDPPPDPVANAFRPKL